LSDLPNDIQLLEEAEPRPLVLPPPYSPRRIEAGDVLAEALRLAPEEGAGTLVWRHGGGVLAFAVVLEPEQPLAQARMAFFAGMCALGDALAAHCAPDRPVRFGWPDTIVYDAARLGGARFAAPEDCAETDVPDWMVFAVELIAERDHLVDPGAYPDSTSLKEEEFEPAEDILASFASYLMLWFDRWEHQGLQADGRALSGAARSAAGDRRALARRRRSGGALPSGEVRQESLADGLAACRWRDAKGRDRRPRL
jgi:hypothetical protein